MIPKACLLSFLFALFIIFVPKANAVTQQEQKLPDPPETVQTKADEKTNVKTTEAEKTDALPKERAVPAAAEIKSDTKDSADVNSNKPILKDFLVSDEKEVLIADNFLPVSKKYSPPELPQTNADESVPTPTQNNSNDDVAKKLANPVAALISVPIKLSYDGNYGVNNDGNIWRTIIQPVIPFSLNEDWNIISRTVFPIVFQNDVPAEGFGTAGLGDTVQSFFFSPKKPTKNGVVWGVGPVFLIPTATDAALGTEKWGIGPTAVVLRQSGQWTVGGLFNHIESFAGDDNRADVSGSLVQPFVSYITKSKTTLAFNTESTYDWNRKKWSVPVNFTVSQLLKAGDQLFQLGAGPRYWATAPDGGPNGWAFSFQLTLLYPK